MNSIEQYIEKIKKYKEEHPDLTETELVRYVYIDLGKRFSFNEKYFFGNEKQKRNIYGNVYNKNDKKLYEILDNEKGICKEFAYLLEKILGEFNVNIRSIASDDDEIHIYNLIKRKDGVEYTIDLQIDLAYIRGNLKTRNFGVSRNGKNQIISFKDLKDIDRKIEYIDKEYADEYYDMMKLDAMEINDIDKKTELVFENIFFDTEKMMEYIELRIFMCRKFEEFFTNKERSNIWIIDCWHELEDNEKDYKMYIYMKTHGVPGMYAFSEEENRFYKITLEEFSDRVSKGLKYDKRHAGITKLLSKINNKKKQIPNNNLKGSTSISTSDEDGR